MVADYLIPEAPQTDEQWLACLTQWCLTADEQGRLELSSAFRQIIQVWVAKLPAEVVQRMLNTGHLMIDTVETAHRMSGRRRSRDDRADKG